MANYVKSGIDVSQWQGTIDWVKVKPQIDFALLRAGYGDTLSYPNQIDTQFSRNYSECKRLGIPVGVYFYSYATTVDMAKREAQSTIALLKGKQFEYPIYYDVEEMSIFNTGKTNEIIQAYCTEMEKAGYWAGIYIYRSAAQSYLNSTTRKRYAMAIAEYGPKLNYSDQYGIWQNSSTMRYNGINGNVDHDYCYVDYPTQIKAKGKNGYAKPKTDERVETTQDTEILVGTASAPPVSAIVGKGNKYTIEKTVKVGSKLYGKIKGDGNRWLDMGKIKHV